jgi:two-component system, OmpR family, response regulator
MRITLVEDNSALAKGIKNALEDQGHAVNWLADGHEADMFLQQEVSDVIVMDINLPGLSGFELVGRLRARGDSTPVILLTARGDTTDRVAGLDVGADDYLVKPFEMSELLARIRALSRRRGPVQQDRDRIGLLTLDRAASQLFGQTGTIDLSRREMALFILLADMTGRIASKTYILENLYGVGSDTEPNAIELLMSRLRRKVGDNGVTFRTVRGLGYVLEVAQE